MAQPSQPLIILTIGRPLPTIPTPDPDYSADVANYLQDILLELADMAEHAGFAELSSRLRSAIETQLDE
jgi:hypothetical protein